MGAAEVAKQCVGQEGVSSLAPLTSLLRCESSPIPPPMDDSPVETPDAMEPTAGMPPISNGSGVEGGGKAMRGGVAMSG